MFSSISLSISLGKVLHKHSCLLCLDSKFNLTTKGSSKLICQHSLFSHMYINPSFSLAQSVPFQSSISVHFQSSFSVSGSSISVFHYSSCILVKCDLEVIHVHKWNKS